MHNGMGHQQAMHHNSFFLNPVMIPSAMMQTSSMTPNGLGVSLTSVATIPASTLGNVPYNAMAVHGMNNSSSLIPGGNLGNMAPGPAAMTQDRLPTLDLHSQNLLSRPQPGMTGHPDVSKMSNNPVVMDPNANSGHPYVSGHPDVSKMSSNPIIDP